jgi:hypothetical protein
VPLTFSRIKKLNHVDTVLYEIDMLRFATGRLAEGDWKEPRDAWVYLESFLVHYRSLLEFFGKPKASDTDIHVTTIWQLEKIPPPETLDKIHATGMELLKRYEPPDTQGGGRISQYVQHCTTKRIEPKDWGLHKMLEDIDPLLAEVEKHLRPYAKAMLTTVQAVHVIETFSASTTVMTATAAVIPEMTIETQLKRDNLK